MHALSGFHSGISRNSQYTTRYFGGYYRVTTPTMRAVYRPTNVPSDIVDVYHIKVTWAPKCGYCGPANHITANCPNKPKGK